MGEPVPGRAVVEPLLGEVAGVGLGDRTGLDRGQGRGELLDPGDHLDQLVVRPRRPQHLRRLPDHGQGLGERQRRPGAGGELRDRHRDIESGATDIPTDIHRVYPIIRDIHRKKLPECEREETATHTSTPNNVAPASERPEAPQPQANRHHTPRSSKPQPQDHRKDVHGRGVSRRSQSDLLNQRAHGCVRTTRCRPVRSRRIRSRCRPGRGRSPSARRSSRSPARPARSHARRSP